jgi:hypothetical protein
MATSFSGSGNFPKAAGAGVEDCPKEKINPSLSVPPIILKASPPSPSVVQIGSHLNFLGVKEPGQLVVRCGKVTRTVAMETGRSVGEHRQEEGGVRMNYL